MDDDPVDADSATEAVRSLRVRSFLARWFPAVVAALVVLALLGGWVTYGAHVAPGFDTRERTVSSWERTGSFDHEATVTRENPVFPVGSELADREFYYRRATPVLDGDFVFGYGASESGSLTLAVDVRLVIRAVSSEENGGEGAGGGDGAASTEFWRVERSLANQTATDVPPGETVTASFPVDVPALGNRTGNITERLGGTPGQVETMVQATVRGSGTVNGRQVERRWTFDLPIVIDGAVYQVDDPGTVRSSEERTETVQVPADVGPVRSVGGPALALAALAALAGLVYRRRTEGFELDAHERELLAYHDDRTEFDEWIVAVAPPERVYDRPRARAASLGDLVDFAIDTDNSVLSPPGERAYLVVEGDSLYVYEPPSPPTDGGPLDAETGHAGTPVDEDGRADVPGTGSIEWDDPVSTESDDPVSTESDDLADESTEAGPTDGTGAADGFEEFANAGETSEEADGEEASESDGPKGTESDDATDD